MDAQPSSNQWDWIYATREMNAVGWYERDPVNSREIVDQAVERGARSIIDIGGGASSLVDHLLELGLDRIAVLDISEAGLAFSKHRLGERADLIEWIVGDVATVDDVGQFDIWHDRAAFHFLPRITEDGAGGVVDKGDLAVQVGFVVAFFNVLKDGAVALF